MMALNLTQHGTVFVPSSIRARFTVMETMVLRDRATQKLVKKKTFERVTRSIHELSVCVKDLHAWEPFGEQVDAVIRDLEVFYKLCPAGIEPVFEVQPMTIDVEVSCPAIRRFLDLVRLWDRLPGTLTAIKRADTQVAPVILDGARALDPQLRVMLQQIMKTAGENYGLIRRYSGWRVD